MFLTRKQLQSMANKSPLHRSRSGRRDNGRKQHRAVPPSPFIIAIDSFLERVDTNDTFFWVLLMEKWFPEKLRAIVDEGDILQEPCDYYDKHGRHVRKDMRVVVHDASQKGRRWWKRIYINTWDEARPKHAS